METTELVRHTHTGEPPALPVSRPLLRKQARFLRTYRETKDLSLTMRQTGTNTITFRHWKARYPMFASKLEHLDELARLSLVKRLEEEAIHRATIGDLTPLVSMGQVVAEVRKKSDKMLELLLRAKDPEHYAPKQQAQSLEMGKKEDGSTYVKAYVGFNPDDV